MPADRDIRPGPVPKEALAYWRAKGLKVGFDHRDVWGEEHDAAFTAAKVMRVDQLEVLKKALGEAIEAGHPFATFKKNIEPALRDAGWWQTHDVTDPETGDVATVEPPKRLKLIYDTNVRVARAVGQWDRIQKEKVRRPYLLYQVGPSKKHREQHLAWHGILLPADDEFWTFAFPPNGYGCKCHVRSVDKYEYARLVKAGTLPGVPEPVLDDEGQPTGHVKQTKVPVQTKAPKVPLVPWQNKRTGETKLVREGIDPGFDRTPGAGRRDVKAAQEKRVREAQPSRKPPGGKKR